MLDSEVGGQRANTYVSIEYADDYFSIDPLFSQTWADLPHVDRERWLQYSTRSLERFGPFEGRKFFEFQALSFPRRRDGYSFVQERRDLPIIPPIIQEAQCQMLVWLFTQKTSAGPIDSRSQESLGLLNGLVKIDYSNDRDEDAEKLGQNSIQMIKSMLAEFRAPIRWERG